MANIPESPDITDDESNNEADSTSLIIDASIDECSDSVIASSVLNKNRIVNVGNGTGDLKEEEQSDETKLDISSFSPLESSTNIYSTTFAGSPKQTPRKKEDIILSDNEPSKMQFKEHRRTISISSASSVEIDDAIESPQTSPNEMLYIESSEEETETESNTNNAVTNVYSITDSEITNVSQLVEQKLDISKKQTNEKFKIGPGSGIVNVAHQGLVNIRKIQEVNAPSNYNYAVASCSNTAVTSCSDTGNQVLKVSQSAYRRQLEKVNEININIQRIQGIFQTTVLKTLPDEGRLLKNRYEYLKKQKECEEKQLSNMKAEEQNKPLYRPPTWEHLQADIANAQAKTQGIKAINTLNMQKALTLEGLEHLHGSLKTQPGHDVYSDNPEGLTVELMPHQKHALSWLEWREDQKPSGGILADDMGLGKTLTMLSLILKSEKPKDQGLANKSSRYNGGSLIVCPASLLGQWESEVKKHVKRGLFTVTLYHGTSRETKAKRLAKQDIVITSYGLVTSDNNRDGPLFGIKWRRIVLDEGHIVRNYKAQGSKAVCELSAKSRWILTGTPVHNKELDLYALLKFLRCAPFDDLIVWKRWISNKGGQDRLHLIVSSLILRRTKQQLAENNELSCLPVKKWELIEIDLQEKEKNIYQKILIFSRTLFAQFLHQRAEAKDDYDAETENYKPNEEYYKMHQRLAKMNKVKKIRQHEILVLLLRLRQICCHPSLIVGMLQKGEVAGSSGSENEEELNILEQLNKLNLNDPVDDQHQPGSNRLSLDTEQIGLAEATRNILNPSNPLFSETYQSSKIRKIINIIVEIPEDDKIIVVSQWARFLNLVSIQLKEIGLKYYQLDGSVPVIKRMDITTNFNNPSNKVKILLLSLTAGGVGLNLIGANHLILCDLHWNPQNELQAQDRIFRLGQKKPVTIYKLMAVDTIEKQIKKLQDRKLNLADGILTGAKIQNKLSLEDLKMLFSV